MKEERMVQVSYVENAARTCPCGSVYQWTSDIDGVQEWTTSHKPHTNGKLLHQVGDDWYRVYGSRPEDYESDIPLT